MRRRQDPNTQPSILRIFRWRTFCRCHALHRTASVAYDSSEWRSVCISFPIIKVPVNLLSALAKVTLPMTHYHPQEKKSGVVRFSVTQQHFLILFPIRRQDSYCQTRVGYKGSQGVFLSCGQWVRAQTQPVSHWPSPPHHPSTHPCPLPCVTSERKLIMTRRQLWVTGRTVHVVRVQSRPSLVRDPRPDNKHHRRLFADMFRKVLSFAHFKKAISSGSPEENGVFVVVVVCI